MTEPKPYGSIVERFRGTLWETPKPPPPRPPRGGRVALVALIAVAVILVVVGSGIALLSQPGTRPGPSQAAVRGQPGVTARVPDSIRVLESYWSFVRTKNLAYHMEATASSNAESFNRSVVMSLDIVGDNYVGTIDSIGAVGRAMVVRLDGVMYIRLPGKDWIVSRLTSPDIQMTPFAGMEGKQELAYDHRIDDGPTVEHLLVTTAKYAPNANRMLGISGLTLLPTTVRLDLIVSDAGVPISATFTFVIERSIADGTPGFVGSAVYGFTRFGEAADIQAPVK